MDLYEIRKILNEGKNIYDIKLKVTYYARVSTDKDEQLHSLKAQINYYQDFIQKNPNWEFVEGYIDEGLSGTSVVKRERFLSMIDDAKLRKFDFIITKEISRFSRNTLDSIKYTQQLLSYGVGVLFQSDNINTLLPDAELRLTIMSSIAQDEVRKTSERVKFGFKRAIENGVVLGNNKLWGYEKKDGILTINEKEAEIVRRIYNMYVTQKMGMRKIASVLADEGMLNRNGNPFSFTTISNILKNPKYKGYYCGGKSQKVDYRSDKIKFLPEEEWIMYKDEENIPPIISEEIWDKAQIIINKRSERMKSNTMGYNNRYKYSGKIFCMEHNLPYHRKEYKYKSGNREHWGCKNYMTHGRNNEKGCKSPILYTDELDIVIRQLIDDIIINKSQIIHDLIKIYTGINSNSNIDSDIAKYKVMMNEILNRKDKLLDLSLKGKISDDEFEDRNNKFNEEIVKCKKEIEILELEKIKNDDINSTINILREMIVNKLNFSDKFKDDFIENLVDKIEVYQGEDENDVNLKVYLKLISENGVSIKMNKKHLSDTSYTHFQRKS